MQHVKYIQGVRLALVLAELHDQLGSRRIPRSKVREYWLTLWPRHAEVRQIKGKPKPLMLRKVAQGVNDLRSILQRLRAFASRMATVQDQDGIVKLPLPRARFCPLDHKLGYPSEALATKALLEIWQKAAELDLLHRRERRVYECDCCGLWKLTSS
ncbi:hypothetical protein [Amycolatopsis sp. CA-230715]|uniref:hypothetical protein n=1 Tax=Amycolatopsis sp. CA-230715 TaxID=2745196 RepID=UPI001C01A9B6|nr:hypothetical protein [Amycolatopsis sp. CA-230715]QWF85618.1 hypothetical protein HUW46_09073 [Amycolatopsis sp. CA-230715]